MKYIEQYNSIRAFKADLNSPECICAAQVPTPVGDAMGYQQNGEFVFSVSGTVISEDSLRTIDLSSFEIDQISSGEVQTFINTCNVGDTMIFKPESGTTIYMDTLNINDKAHWDGFALTLGVKEDDLYPYIKVWLDDGSVDTIDNDDDLEGFDSTNAIKITIGESWVFEKCSVPIFNSNEELRYMVVSKTQTQFSSVSFAKWGEAFRALTINNTTPPSLIRHFPNDYVDMFKLPSCQRIYVPKGSKSTYIGETNWKNPDIASKIYEF